MKKLFAILTATLVVCGLCVAPAFASITNTSELKDLDHSPYYPTEVTDIDIDEGSWLPEALIPIPRYMEDIAPIVEFDTPDAPGDYEFHFYAAEEDQPLPYDMEINWDDGTGAYFAWAETEDEAVSMAEQYVTDNQSETKQFSDVESGTYEAVTETEWVVDQEFQPAWTERIEHAAETHTEAITEEVSEGWAKCDKDGQSSYDFTGDKLIIHDGQSGYWFWSAQPMDNWKSFAASTGINKADQVATARSGYDSFTFGNKTFTIKPGNISANGGISWTAWEHFKTTEVGTKTVVDKEAWIELIDHPAVLESGHYETTVIEPAVGWANVTWETIEAPIPVDPEEPNNDGPNPGPVRPEPEPTPVVPADVVVPDNPEQATEVTISNNDGGTFYLPKTGDRFGDMDSIIAITITACLGAIFLALCRRYEEE